MPGMGTGLATNDPIVVAAFHAALLHQGLVVLAIAFVALLVGNLVRVLQARRPGGDRALAAQAATVGVLAEPAGRRLLRVSFGLIWILDGILQAQAAMPLGMIPQVVKPAASSSPGWVQHLVNSAATVWSYHPVTAAAAAVWIQVGIGVWLLVAPRGDWSRLAGIASATWGLLVWVFGEAFGGIFAPGLTWLFGAPGAVVFYSVAGMLVTFPDRWWTTPRLGRLVLRVMGLFFVGMAVLQAWPGRGFWQGQPRPQSAQGTLTAMVSQMAQVTQPRLLEGWVNSFASFDAAHGFAVNLFAVVALAAIGAAFLTGRRRPVRVAVIAGVLVCLADWVLVEDFGFLGGVGTDPNSMIPMALVLVAGYLALTRLAPATDDTVVAMTPAGPAEGVAWRDRVTVRPIYAFQVAAAIGAVAITVVGAAPMAVAAANPNADPILTQAVDGGPAAIDTPAPAFRLLDQSGRPVTLASLHGKAIALTFLDPVCVNDCPIIAQELRQAGQLLGSADRHVELVAVDANPRYISRGYTAAFTHQELLDTVANWRYLTGSLPDLQRLWRAFGVQVDYAPGGSMIAHSDIAYVIDPTGHTRDVIDADPGPGTPATMSSFAAVLAHALRHVLTPA